MPLRAEQANFDLAIIGGGINGVGDVLGVDQVGDGARGAVVDRAAYRRADALRAAAIAVCGRRGCCAWACSSMITLAGARNCRRHGPAAAYGTAEAGYTRGFE